MDIKEYLEKKYLDWERLRGKRGSLTQFANYYGLKQSSLTQWMTTGREPNAKSLGLLSDVFGPEILIMCGITTVDKLDEYLKNLKRERMSPWMRFVYDNFEKLPEHQQKQFAEEIEQEARAAKNKHSDEAKQPDGAAMYAVKP